MAELQTHTIKKGNKRMIKKSTRVDLTPMVDLGFLLLTFFVFTTTLNLPTTMNIELPRGKADDPVCKSCAITVLLDKDNLIRYYEGDLADNPSINTTNFSAEGIRKILLEKRKAVKAARGSADEFTLIVKPSDASTFQNFVDMMDEVAINNIKKYYEEELTEADRKVLKR